MRPKSKWYELGHQDGVTVGQDCKLDGTYSYDFAGLEAWDAWLINGLGRDKVAELLECEIDSQEWIDRLTEYADGAMHGYALVGVEAS